MSLKTHPRQTWDSLDQDKTKMDIYVYLQENQPATCREIADSDIGPSAKQTISRHLNEMERNGVVEYEREPPRNTKYWYLDEEALDFDEIETNGPHYENVAEYMEYHAPFTFPSFIIFFVSVVIGLLSGVIGIDPRMWVVLAGISLTMIGTVVAIGYIEVTRQ